MSLSSVLVWLLKALSGSSTSVPAFIEVLLIIGEQSFEVKSPEPSLALASEGSQRLFYQCACIY